MSWKRLCPLPSSIERAVLPWSYWAFCQLLDQWFSTCRSWPLWGSHSWYRAYPIFILWFMIVAKLKWRGSSETSFVAGVTRAWGTAQGVSVLERLGPTALDLPALASSRAFFILSRVTRLSHAALLNQTSSALSSHGPPTPRPSLLDVTFLFRLHLWFQHQLLTQKFFSC